METFCHSVTKMRSKYREIMGSIGILILSPNCRRESLLVIVLANLVFKTEVPKHQDSSTGQGHLDRKIACPDVNSSKCNSSPTQGPIRTRISASYVFCRRKTPSGQALFLFRWLVCIMYTTLYFMWVGIYDLVS
jgi:hypothetical protein